MALIAQHPQGLSPTTSLNRIQWTEGVKLRSFISFQLIGKADHVKPLKQHFCFRDHHIIQPKRKIFKVKSFKGNPRNNEPNGRVSSSSGSGAKFVNAPIHLSQKKPEREEIVTEVSDAENLPLSYASEDREDTSVRSLAIQNLFRKWLIVLRSKTSGHTTISESSTEMSDRVEVSESQNLEFQKKLRLVMRASVVYFLGLDAAISLPLLIFIPGYLAVNVAYGAEVAKELTPLWVLGPMILALYIKIVQGLFSLYLYCFIQAVRLVKGLPTYAKSAYSYVAEGKLKAFFWFYFWKPIVDIKNMDYRELFRQRLVRLKEWAVEKYLDYVESIWPYYCRTIRFLKQANLI